MKPEYCNISARLLFVNTSGDLHGWWKNPDKPTFWRFYWNDCSGAYVQFSGHRYDLEPERFVLIAPGTKYTAACPGHARQFYIHFLLGGVFADIAENVFSAPVKGNIPLDLLRRGMMTAAEETSNYATGFLAMRILMCAVNAAVPVDLISNRMVDPRIQKVTDLMDTCYANFSNEELSDIANLSLSAFIRMFKREKGVSPQKYAMRERIREACRILQHSDWSIPKIADHLYFNDRYHFSRVFKQINGTGPAEYRNRYSVIR